MKIKKIRISNQKETPKMSEKNYDGRRLGEIHSHEKILNAEEGQRKAATKLPKEFLQINSRTTDKKTSFC